MVHCLVFDLLCLALICNINFLFDCNSIFLRCMFYHTLRLVAETCEANSQTYYKDTRTTVPGTATLKLDRGFSDFKV